MVLSADEAKVGKSWNHNVSADKPEVCNNWNNWKGSKNQVILVIPVIPVIWDTIVFSADKPNA